jgi:hypothetical protein
MNLNNILKDCDIDLKKENIKVLCLVYELSKVIFYYNNLICKYSTLYNINLNLRKENEQLKMKLNEK